MPLCAGPSLLAFAAIAMSLSAGPFLLVFSANAISLSAGPVLLAFAAIAVSLSAGPVLLASFRSPALAIAPSLPVPFPVGLLPWLSDIILCPLLGAST
jgi:hypothetical protein